MRSLIRNVRVVGYDSYPGEVNILIDGDRIVRISHEQIDVPAYEYDLSGYTIMPGFIHTHVHLFDCFDGFNEEKLHNWLMSGITCLRDEGILSGCTTREASQWREAHKNHCVYPDIRLCGHFIAASGGYGGIAPVEVSDTQQARQAVRKLLDDGADHIKISLDKGFDPYTQSLSMLTPDLLIAICDETHKHGKRVSAHVLHAEQLSVLLHAGIDEAAHTCCDYIPDETLYYMKENSIGMTPTLSVFGEISVNYGVPIIDTAMDNVRRFSEMGGIIGLGNDYIEEKAIWSPVGMPMMEIELLRQAGMSMNEIICAATHGGAQIIDSPERGRIAEGYKADIIALKGDPCQMPYLLTNVQFIMKSGVVVKNVL